MTYLYQCQFFETEHLQSRKIILKNISEIAAKLDNDRLKIFYKVILNFYN